MKSAYSTVEPKLILIHTFRIVVGDTQLSHNVLHNGHQMDNTPV